MRKGGNSVMFWSKKSVKMSLRGSQNPGLSHSFDSQMKHCFVLGFFIPDCSTTLTTFVMLRKFLF